MLNMFCCCECGNSDFIETTITTDHGDEHALECVRCHEILATETLIESWFAVIPNRR